MWGLVCVAAALAVATAAQAQQQVTISGPVVDDYCWTTLGGTALDTGADLKEVPNTHTVHCLVEVSVCRNSGFHIVHKPEGASEYTIEATFDANGNALAIAEMEKTPADERNLQRGWQVVATGTLTNSTPPVLQVTSLEAGEPAPVAAAPPSLAATAAVGGAAVAALQLAL